MKEDIFDMGQIKMPYHNTEICIYNLERMLIELVRFRGKLPFGYYKEIIGAYRNRVETMDIVKAEDYAARFEHSDVSDFFISRNGKKHENSKQIKWIFCR